MAAFCFYCCPCCGICFYLSTVFSLRMVAIHRGPALMEVAGGGGYHCCIFHGVLRLGGWLSGSVSRANHTNACFHYQIVLHSGLTYVQLVGQGTQRSNNTTDTWISLIFRFRQEKFRISSSVKGKKRHPDLLYSAVDRNLEGGIMVPVGQTPNWGSGFKLVGLEQASFHLVE